MGFSARFFVVFWVFSILCYPTLAEDAERVHKDDLETPTGSTPAPEPTATDVIAMIKEKIESGDPDALGDLTEEQQKAITKVLQDPEGAKELQAYAQDKPEILSLLEKAAPKQETEPNSPETQTASNQPSEDELNDFTRRQEQLQKDQENLQKGQQDLKRQQDQLAQQQQQQNQQQQQQAEEEEKKDEEEKQAAAAGAGGTGSSGGSDGGGYGNTGDSEGKNEEPPQLFSGVSELMKLYSKDSEPEATTEKSPAKERKASSDRSPTSSSMTSSAEFGNQLRDIRQKILNAVEEAYQ